MQSSSSQCISSLSLESPSKLCEFSFLLCPFLRTVEPKVAGVRFLLCTLQLDKVQSKEKGKEKIGWLYSPHWLHSKSKSRMNFSNCGNGQHRHSLTMLATGLIIHVLTNWVFNIELNDDDCRCKLVRVGYILWPTVLHSCQLPSPSKVLWTIWTFGLVQSPVACSLS